MKLFVLILCAFLFTSPAFSHFMIGTKLSFVLPVSAYAEEVPTEKSKKYVYKDKVFMVSLSKDGVISVSKDGVTGTIRVNEENGQFLIRVPDSMIGQNYDDTQQALNRVCDRILTKISASSKEVLEKRHSQLEDLFKKIKD